MNFRTAESHPPAGRAGKGAAALFLVVAGFQAALACGAPWGAAAYGGSNPGVLPDTLRLGSAGLAAVYLVLAAAAGTRLTGPTLRRRLMYGTAGLMTLGFVMNLASPSLVERMIWVPVTVGLVVLLRAAGRGSITPALKPAPGSAA
jgi:hypothetical protein